MNTDSGKIFAVVLAAGSASRFGSTKQLASVDETPLVRRVLDIATDCFGDNTVLVVGHDWKSVVDACFRSPGFVVVNEHYTKGLGSSIAAAVNTIMHTATGIVVVLADQPLISTTHLDALREAWSGDVDEIVATGFDDTIGPPVLFPENCFPELAALAGDAGGRHLLDDDRFVVKRIRFEDASVDIDTPDDLRRI